MSTESDDRVDADTSDGGYIVQYAAQKVVKDARSNTKPGEVFDIANTLFDQMVHHLHLTVSKSRRGVPFRSGCAGDVFHLGIFPSKQLYRWKSTFCGFLTK